MLCSTESKLQTGDTEVSNIVDCVNRPILLTVDCVNQTIATSMFYSRQNLLSDLTVCESLLHNFVFSDLLAVN